MTISHPLSIPEDPPIESQPLPDEKPPAYDGMMWSNERPIGSGFLAEMGMETTSSSSSPAVAPPNSMISTSLPMTSVRFEGPRRVTIQRGPNGFGITLGGSQPPCRIVSIDSDSPAHGPDAAHSLYLNERILEVNGVDVTVASLDTVSALIRSTPSTLHVVVVPGQREEGEAVSGGLNGLWAAATFNTREDPNQFDPSARPINHMGLAATSILCCPLVGIVAVYHAVQVGRAWARRQATAARAHSLMARRLASASIFYGGLAIMFYLFLQAEKERVKAAENP